MSWKDIFPKENRYFETENGVLYCNEAVEHCFRPAVWKWNNFKDG